MTAILLRFLQSYNLYCLHHELVFMIHGISCFIFQKLKITLIDMIIIWVISMILKQIIESVNIMFDSVANAVVLLKVKVLFKTKEYGFM